MSASAIVSSSSSPASISWECVPLTDLSVMTLYDVIQLRANVFIVEQECIYLDLDGYDKTSLHVIGTLQQGDAKKIAAYARVLPPRTKGETQTRPMIGRVVIAPDARGAGLARVLMEQAIAACSTRWPHQGIDIGAQAHLETFYTSLGFHTTSPAPYDEDGIP
ncbi:hypothetical protein As57867_003556, partial [Aphanomyces stellatus]